MARKVSVSMLALIQRINRNLYADDEVLKAPRSERRSRDKLSAKRRVGQKRQSSER